MKETYREIIEDKFEVANIKQIVAAIRDGGIDVLQTAAPSPSPMAFGIATLGVSDAVYVKDKLSLLREFQRRVISSIAGEMAA